LYVSLVSIFQFVWLTEHDGGYNAEPQSVYLGCFIDSMNRTDLPSKWSLYSVTIDSCLQASYLHGNEYFGLQSGEECWTGDSAPSTRRVPDEDCNTPCKDNTTQLCGGTWRNSFYKVVLSDESNGYLAPGWVSLYLLLTGLIGIVSLRYYAVTTYTNVGPLGDDDSIFLNSFFFSLLGLLSLGVVVAVPVFVFSTPKCAAEESVDCRDSFSSYASSYGWTSSSWTSSSSFTSSSSWTSSSSSTPTSGCSWYQTDCSSSSLWQCVDDSNWVDADGYTCLDWTYNPSWCHDYASSDSIFGIPVEEACCVCKNTAMLTGPSSVVLTFLGCFLIAL